MGDNADQIVEKIIAKAEEIYEIAKQIKQLLKE
jgi:hypothetical protein